MVQLYTYYKLVDWDLLKIKKHGEIITLQIFINYLLRAMHFLSLKKVLLHLSYQSQSTYGHITCIYMRTSKQIA